MRTAGRHRGVEVQVEPVVYLQSGALDSQNMDLVVALVMELAENHPRSGSSRSRPAGWRPPLVLRRAAASQGRD